MSHNKRRHKAILWAKRGQKKKGYDVEYQHPEWVLFLDKKKGINTKKDKGDDKNG